MTPERKAAEEAAACLLTDGKLTWDRFRNRLIDGKPPKRGVGLGIAMIAGLLMEQFAPDQVEHDFRNRLIETFRGKAKKVVRVADEHWATLCEDYRDALAPYAPPEACSTANAEAHPK